MQLKLISIAFTLACCTMQAQAQQSVADSLLLQYRHMALDYNHDLKTAVRNVSASVELEKAARKDLAPKISGSADFSYTGRPLTLTVDAPAITSAPLTFEGQRMKYGVSLDLVQPVYAGGLLLENIRMAEHRHSLAAHEEAYFRSAVCYQTDLQYWNTVARAEVVAVAEDYRNAVDSFARTIRERVEAGLAEPQDLLMAEVKLNEAEYQLLQARNSFTTGRMALNSLIGTELEAETAVPDTVPLPLTPDSLWSMEANNRPELGMAYDHINIAKSTQRLAVGKYRPQLYVGASGSLSAPGYNLTPDMNPNYTVYATLSVPITQWGKKRNERQAYSLRTESAQDQLNKVADNIALEVATARLSLTQALEQAELTASSLKKASANERMALDRYEEGDISVVEVIEAQTYRLSAQTHYVQAKATAQACYSALVKAVNGY